MSSQTGARIILNTRFFHVAKPGEKADGKHSLTKDAAGGLIEYIGTREGVSLNLSSKVAAKPATQHQEDTIQQILHQIRDSKNLFEYRDYLENPTIGNASEFITRACEMELEGMEMGHAVDTGGASNLIEYIGKRPGAVRVGEHGLFSYSDEVDIKKAQQEIADCKGNIWTHVISIRREDAERLGYNTQKPWRDMVCRKIEIIAKEHNIPPGQLHWYGGMHNTGHHPHIHLVVFADDGCKPHLSKDGIKTMKSQFANVIFKDDLIQIYDQKTQYRNELRQEVKKQLKEICDDPQKHFTDKQLQSLAKKLLTIKEARGDNAGSHAYRYAKTNVKNLVDSFMAELIEVPKLKELYELYGRECLKIESFYMTEPENIKTILDNEEFKGIRTAVIKAADTLKPINIQVTDDSIIFDDSPPPPDIHDEIFIAENNPTPIENYNNEAFAGDFLPADNTSVEAEGSDISETPFESEENLTSLLDNVPPESMTEESPPLDTLNDFEPQEKHSTPTNKDSFEDPFEDTAKDTFQELYQKAFAGNHYAQYKLAKMYFYGKDVERDYIQAQMWYGLAAEGGHSFAKYELGKMHLYGIGIEQNKDLGKDYCLDAYYSFRFELADKLEYDVGKEIDTIPLEEISFPEIESNQAYIAYSLGRMQYAGEGVDRDYDKAFKWFALAANSGHLHSEYYIAKMFYGGQGVKQDYEQALAWYQSAAGKEDKYAYYALGKMYYNGIGANQDYAEAVNWFKKASSEKVSYADYQLAKMYEKGLGVEMDENTACRYYKNALEEFIKQEAQQPDAIVEYRIAQMCFSGKGVAVNLQKGTEWLNKCAEKENPYAQFELATMYQSGESIPMDTEKAASLYHSALTGFIQMEKDTPSTSLKYRIAQMYEKGLGTEADFSKAFEWFLKAAENEHPHAMYTVAKYYFEGISVDQDYQEAVQWYTKAADHEDQYAIHTLGKLYRSGIGVEKDTEKAFQYFSKAAALGNPYSQLAVAQMYLAGEGTIKSPEQAAKWFSKCAEIGNPFAQYQLGNLYSKGIGLEKDEQQAQMNFEKALTGFLTIEQEKPSESLEYRIAQMYEKEQGTEPNLNTALPWYIKAADNGNAYAAFRLGRYYQEDAPNPEESQKYFKLALAGFLSIEQEKPSEALEQQLAQMYEKGQGTEPNLDTALPWYIKAAENGNAYAAFRLGRYYQEEIPNPEESQKYFKIALDGFLAIEQEKPSESLEYRIAQMYEKGQGTEPNLNTALPWYIKAADNGNAYAAFRLGRYYQEDAANPKESQKYFKLALAGFLSIEQEKPSEALEQQLAQMYEKGQGTEPNLDTAHPWYIKAAENGNAYAAFRLGRYYQEEIPNPEESQKYFKIALDGFLTMEQEKPSESLEYRIAQMYKKGQGAEPNSDKAEKWYLKASEKGNAYASLSLASFYEKTNSIVSNQFYTKALKQFLAMEKLKPAGNTESMIGYLFSCGKGIPSDKILAERWYRIGLSNGNKKAELGLAYLYTYAFDDSMHKKQAFQMFMKLAQSNDTKAICQIGKMYQYGIGVERNFENAKEWFSKAAELGDENAKNDMDKLEQQMMSAAIGVVGRIAQLFASNTGNHILDHINRQLRSDKKLRQQERGLKEALGQRDEMVMS